MSLGEAEESRIRAAIEERVRKATDEAMRDLWNRVYKAVRTCPSGSPPTGPIPPRAAVATSKWETPGTIST